MKPFAILSAAVCLGAPLAAQQGGPAPAPGGERKNYSVTVKLMVHVSGVPQELIEGVLMQVRLRASTRQVLLASYGIDGDHQSSNLHTTPLVPGRQQLVTLFYSYNGSKPPTETDAAAAAVAKEFEQGLDLLLFQPRLQDLQRQLERAQAVLAGAEERLAKASARLLALSGDAPEAARRTVAGLQHELLDVELEQRTEQAMQERLQGQLQQAARELQHIGQREQSLIEGIGKLQVEVAALQQGQAPPKGAEALLALQNELRQLEGKRAEVTADAAQARRLRDAAAEQLVAGTLALQRHLSRRQVLEDLIARQQKLLEEAIVQDRDRQQVQRQAEAARAEADAAGSRLRELQQQREALEPVRVTPWE